MPRSAAREAKESPDRAILRMRIASPSVGPRKGSRKRNAPVFADVVSMEPEPSLPPPAASCLSDPDGLAHPVDLLTVLKSRASCCLPGPSTPFFKVSVAKLKSPKSLEQDRDCLGVIAANAAVFGLPSFSLADAAVTPAEPVPKHVSAKRHEWWSKHNSVDSIRVVGVMYGLPISGKESRESLATQFTKLRLAPIRDAVVIEFYEQWCQSRGAASAIADIAGRAAAAEEAKSVAAAEEAKTAPAAEEKKSEEVSLLPGGDPAPSPSGRRLEFPEVVTVSDGEEKEEAQYSNAEVLSMQITAAHLASAEAARILVERSAAEQIAMSAARAASVETARLEGLRAVAVSTEKDRIRLAMAASSALFADQRYAVLGMDPVNVDLATLVNDGLMGSPPSRVGSLASTVPLMGSPLSSPAPSLAASSTSCSPMGSPSGPRVGGKIPSGPSLLPSAWMSSDSAAAQQLVTTRALLTLLERSDKGGRVSSRSSKSNEEKNEGDCRDRTENKLFWHLARMSESNVAKLRRVDSGYGKQANKMVLGAHGLEVMDGRLELTFDDMTSLEGVRQGAEHYLDFIRESQDPEVRALLPDRRAFFRAVMLLVNFRPVSVARFTVEFIRKYVEEESWMPLLRSDAVMVQTYLEKVVEPTSGRIRSMGNGPYSRSRSGTPTRPPRQPASRAYPGRRATLSERPRKSAGVPPSYPPAPSKSGKFCFSRVKLGSKCVHNPCRFSHSCASCNDGKDHTADACPSFDAARAARNAASAGR
jgi:hypothetical protein